MKILSAFPYKSPREGTLTSEEARIREAAYDLKTAERWAVELAAHRAVPRPVHGQPPCHR